MTLLKEIRCSPILEEISWHLWKPIKISPSSYFRSSSKKSIVHPNVMLMIPWSRCILPMRLQFKSLSPPTIYCHKIRFFFFKEQPPSPWLSELRALSWFIGPCKAKKRDKLQLEGERSLRTEPCVTNENCSLRA